jgi:esterase/lipase superfamily enzyme
MQTRYLRIPSPAMERDVHLWQFGHFGAPVIVFPTAAGFAHEWQSQGMIEALAPLINAGKIKLYCPESNVAETLTRKDRDPAHRISRYTVYERFINETLVPYVREDCHSANIRIATVGASLGGLYAANFVLKFPDTFWWGLCMSGRYEIRPFLDHFDSREVYQNNPLAYAYALEGAALEKIKQRAKLTLVCGQGKWEEGCIEETQELGAVLAKKGVPVHTDIWGRDVRHDWEWWKRQAMFHFRNQLA